MNHPCAAKAPLKAGLEDHFQRVHEALLLVLKRTVADDIRDVEAFLGESIERLAARPQSVEDIAVAQRHWRDIDASREALRAKSRGLVDFGALLASHAAGSAVDGADLAARTVGLEPRWAAFDDQMEAFNEMIEIQKESLKVRLEEQVIEQNQAIDKFAERWRALRPAELRDWDAASVARTFDELDEWRAQLEDFKERAAELGENFASFHMPVPPRFDGLAVVEVEIEATAGSWRMLRDYLRELGELEAMDWIGFRSDIFALQDLAARWGERLKERYAAGGGGHDAVLAHLGGALDAIKAAAPALKYCHGKDFKEEHWSALLQGKLGLGKDVRLETLTVGHFTSARAGARPAPAAGRREGRRGAPGTPREAVARPDRGREARGSAGADLGGGPRTPRAARPRARRSPCSATRASCPSSSSFRRRPRARCSSARRSRSSLSGAVSAHGRLRSRLRGYVASARASGAYAGTTL